MDRRVERRRPMKQLMIFCSSSEEDFVVTALDRAGVDGFLRIGGATGGKFLERNQVPRTISWEATLMIVPAVSDECARTVVRELGEYSRNCEIEPCLRVVVTETEEAGEA
jgi:hypothetical protein